MYREESPYKVCVAGACGVWQGPATGLQLRPEPGALRTVLYNPVMCTVNSPPYEVCVPGAHGVWQGPATGLQLRPDPGALGQMGEWEGRVGVYPSSLAALLTNSWGEMVSLRGGGDGREEMQWKKK